MPLSEDEKRTFELLEAQLLETDPKFARTMQSAGSVGRFSQRRIVIGILAIIAGLAIILAGISTKLIFLGIIGFAIMGSGAYYAFTKVSGQPSGPGAKTKNQSNFMKRLEDNWEIRRQREGM